MPTGSLQVVVTHSGAFHADDVVAYATLRTFLGDGMAIVRTRDPAKIAGADIVFDVGGVHDVATRRFDHHQRGAPRRSDGEPYSSAGLVWEAYGRDALRSLLPDAADEEIGAVWSDLDRTFILPLDRLDNGEATDDALSLSWIVETFVPTWEERDPDIDARFLAAAAVVEAILARQARQSLARVRARAFVLAASRAAADPRLLVLDHYAPWHETAHEEGLPALYAIYPGSTPGGWMLNAVPTGPGRIDPKLPLPAEWAGLRGEDLAAVSGVPDAVFCHNARFVCAARSLEGAVALARIALARAGESAPPAATVQDARDAGETARARSPAASTATAARPTSAPREPVSPTGACPTRR